MRSFDSGQHCVLIHALIQMHTAKHIGSFYCLLFMWNVKPAHRYKTFPHRLAFSSVSSWASSSTVSLSGYVCLIHKQSAVSYLHCWMCCVKLFVMRGNAALVLERCSTAWAWVQPKYFWKSHPSLLYSLPSLDRGTLISSCFLAICDQWCMLADFIGTFSALQNLLEPELGSVLVCPGVE